MVSHPTDTWSVNMVSDQVGRCVRSTVGHRAPPRVSLGGSGSDEVASRDVCRAAGTLRFEQAVTGFAESRRSW